MKDYINKELSFVSHDGVSLYYQQWKKEGNKKAIIMFHRGHEHSNRIKHLVHELNLQDYDFYAWDARGHGKSPGDRGYAPNVAHVVKDIDYFIKHISRIHNIDIRDMIVLGQSVGAVTLSTWLHDYAPKVKAAILASPAFKVKLYVPLAIPALKALQRISNKEKYVSSYVKGELLSHDPLRIEEYNTDKTITKPISVGMLVDLYDTSKRIVADAYAIETPVLMLVSGNDWVVEKEPQYAFFAKLPSKCKELHEIPNFYHDTLGEAHREVAFDYIRNFIEKIENETLEKNNLTTPNTHHFSYMELNDLKQYQNPLEERFYDLQKRALKFASKFSDSIRVGTETGFDSGSTLDYVYRNQVTSDNPLGKLIDKTYLNAVGWKGIRVRKENLEKAFSWVHQRKPLLKFVDIAAGHGRYDIDFLKTLNKESYSAILNDYSELNLVEGKKLITDYNLEQNIIFQKGNAFDTEYVKILTKDANLVVVSGLYELYPDNQIIENSLRGISEGIEEGGYLVYTNQPWHPQLKFIAKVLSSHRQGQPWVMRRRTQEEMDQLVEKFGFDKVEQFIDPYGIFTVSIAKKL